MRNLFVHAYFDIVLKMFVSSTFLFLSSHCCIQPCDSAKLIDIYRTRHNISSSTGLNEPAVATGISELIYEVTKAAPVEEPDTLDDDLVNVWAANLGDDGLWGKNAPAMNRVGRLLYLLLIAFIHCRVHYYNCT